jgi:hypothetical protein
MTMKESAADNSGSAVAKKPYEKPSFRYEQVFVTSALTCGKVSITESQCTTNLKAS